MNTLAPFVVGILLVSLVVSWRRERGALSGFDKASTIPLRGFLVLLVVLGHLDSLLGRGTSVITWIHWATPAVNVFFFMSGFGCQKSIMRNTGYLKGFLGRTAIKLLIPFLSCSVIYVLWRGLQGVRVWEGAVSSICKGGTPFLPYSWYVFALLLYSICFLVCHLVCKGRWVIGGLVAVMASSYCLFGWGLDWEAHLWWSGWSFCGGVAWAYYESLVRTALQSSTSMVFLLVIAIYSTASLLAHFLPSHTPVISELPYACLGPVCYLLISYWGTIPGRALRWLGSEAYEIYLLHGVFLSCLKPLSMGNFEWGLLSVLTTVVCAWPLHWAHGQIIRFLRK